MGLPGEFTIDIEPTNRCNADCYFCPRDQTPHQGLMPMATYEAALARSVELRDAVAAVSAHRFRVALCGLGEPLLNKRTPDYIAMARQAGFPVSLASNGALLDPRRSDAVLDAGLDYIGINVGDIGEDYEDVYKLPWDKTLANIRRFIEMAAGRCQVAVVLVDHRDDPGHVAEARRFWESEGVTEFQTFPLINRGGALSSYTLPAPSPEVAEEATSLIEGFGVQPACNLPFVSTVIGYDGVYYLCCSDWKKEVPLGTVFDRSLLDVLGEKLLATVSRTGLCASCSLDPTFRIEEQVRASADGGPVRGMGSPRFAARHAAQETRQLADLLRALRPELADVDLTPRPTARPGRARIPVQVV